MDKKIAGKLIAMSHQETKDGIALGRPIIRAVVAFLVYLRGSRGQVQAGLTNIMVVESAPTVEQSYAIAGNFMGKLEKEIDAGIDAANTASAS